MCVCYVRVKEKPGNGGDMNIRPGQVVFARPDGWIFGGDEIASIDHRILLLDGMPDEYFSGLEGSARYAYGGEVYRKRQLQFNAAAVDLLLRMASPISMTPEWAYAMLGAVENPDDYGGV